MSKIEFLKNSEGKILCDRCHSLPAVGEANNPKEWLCKRCMEESYWESDEPQADDTLIFCETEWNNQEK